MDKFVIVNGGTKKQRQLVLNIIRLESFEKLITKPASNIVN